MVHVSTVNRIKAIENNSNAIPFLLLRFSSFLRFLFLVNAFLFTGVITDFKHNVRGEKFICYINMKKSRKYFSKSLMNMNSIVYERCASLNIYMATTEQNSGRVNIL